jgi:CDP-paratose 2-epimerase
MNVAIITGSSGLIGGESVEFFSDKFDVIVGIDNDLRSYFWFRLQHQMEQGPACGQN